MSPQPSGSSEAARAAVRAAYVDRRQSLTRAAAETGITAGTARKYKREAAAAGDDWDRSRALPLPPVDTRQLLVQALIEDYVRLHQATQQALLAEEAAEPLARAEALSRLANAFTKTMAAAGRAAPEITALTLAGEFVRELAGFVEAHHPDAMPALAAVLEPFGQHLLKKYG
jgi:hypothetical protein